MKKGKTETTEGIKLPNQESIRMLEEMENSNYLRILKVNTIRRTEMKEKKKKQEYPRQNFSKPTEIFSMA